MKKPVAEKNPALIQADAELCEQVINGDPQAGMEFYTKYNRLASYFGNIAARQCRTGIIDFDDLRQDALEYMLRQAKTFIPEKGMRFSTHVNAYFSQYLRRRVDQQYGAHLPDNIQLIVNTVIASDGQRATTQRPLISDEEMAEEFNILVGPPDDRRVTTGAIRQAIMLTTYLGSIDNGFSPNTEISPGNEYTLDEISDLTPLTTVETPAPEDKATESALAASVDSLLDLLSEREADIIRMRFGITPYSAPMTLDQIGDELGLSRERIRIIESRTMAKLRHPSRSSELRDFLED